MGRTIGVVVSSRIVAGLIEDHKLVGPLGTFPENPDDHEALLEYPFESLCHLISDQVLALHPEGKFDAIGVAIPGIIRDGICEDSPNLAQLKGAKVAESLAAIFQSKGIDGPLKALNDADAVAAGLAVTQGRMDRLVRVWTIGNGIGFGRFPYVSGVWEGGQEQLLPKSCVRIRTWVYTDRINASVRCPGQTVDAVERGSFVALSQGGVIEHRIDEVVQRAAEGHDSLPDMQ